MWTQHRSRTFTYRRLTRATRARTVMSALTSRRRVILAWWIHLLGAGVGLACLLVVPGWVRWPLAAVLAGTPWMVSIATAFTADQRAHTFRDIAAALFPQRARRRTRAWLEAQLAAPPFPIHGVTDEESTLLGWGGDEVLGLASMEVACCSWDTPTGPFVRVDTRGPRAEPVVHPAWELVMRLRSVTGGPIPEPHQPIPAETERVVVSVEGEEVPAEAARDGEAWAALVVVGGQTLIVTASGVEVDQVRLGRVDPTTLELPPWL